MVENLRRQLGTWDTILEKSKKSENRSKFLEEMLRMATWARHFDIMKKLIVDENVDPNSKQEFEGTTSIHLAARQEDPITLRFLLSLSEKININIQDARGETPLILACILARSVEVVQLILSCPTLDVNLANNKGMTALHAASYQGHETIVSMLLGHEHIQVNKGDSNKDSPLMVACNESYLGVIRLLLNRDDIDINAKNKYNRTALTISCERKTVESERNVMESQGIFVTLFLDDMILARIHKRNENQPENISMLLQREELEITTINLQAITDFVMNTSSHGIDIRDARDMRALIEEAASKNLVDIARWLLRIEGYLFRESTATAALWGSSASARRPLKRRYVKGDQRQTIQTLQQLTQQIISDLDY